MRGDTNGFAAYDAREQEREEKARAQRERAAATWDVWDAGNDDYKIPPRGWLLGNVFCRKFLSSLIADGGVGKTALRIAQLVSLALKKSLTGEHVFQRCRVLIVSLEDDRDELRRRVRAVMLKYGIAPEDVKGWLFLVAPKGLKLAEMSDGSPQAGELERLIRDEITSRKLDIVSLDPFIKSHGLDENSNGAIDYVCGLLASIASDLNCAIDFPHHTNKGIATPGDANKGRGASSMKDAARLVYTLTPMDAEEAKLFNLSDGDRRFLVRMDSGKVNIAPASTKATWFKLIGVPLGNASDLYRAGDEVQTVEPWTPPDVLAGLDSRLINTILDDIDVGLGDGQLYSAAGAAGPRAAWAVVQRHSPDKSEKQCRAAITIWKKNGVLVNDEYYDRVDRKTCVGLRVVLSKRPT